ncbi:glutathione S-transferase family protein [Bradyrhizobium sp. Ash2021]|uniref:glutathione S-transferase family protein n=1 Tax=Bradyrhizobium sp. Ash2021 TaxID=2954771 RepID=UPI002815C00A|nr:glutathione S-transferase family protein [Bradyrhizobium sp. Ash2021]WMT76320.1 glutathione S-transferase family protein [Bradyrhizobium sp. Ash2021]
MSEMYKLYGTPTSYYTAKVRAYLRYKAIPYEEILTTEEVYRNVIVARTGVWMIPTLVTPDGKVVQDSTEIIDLLEDRYPQAPVHPVEPWQRLSALLMELYGDEWLIMTAIHYRWTKPENREFAIEEFGKQARPTGSPQEQREAGLEKARIFGGWVGLFGIDANTGPAIEEAYEEFLGALNEHFRDYEFLFGSRPSIADFSFFGGLYAVLNRDPLSGRLMKSIAPRVVQWVERMLEPKPRSGDFLPNDQVSTALNPILRAIFHDQFPVLREIVDRVDSWSRDNAGVPFPKTIGLQDFELRGRRGSRCVYPYPQWMLQRVLQHYRSIDPSQRKAVDAQLRDLGGFNHMQIEIPQPIVRSEFRLRPAATNEA